VRRKPPRRRVVAMRRDERPEAHGPNQVWAMDWIYDELFDGRRLWVLTVVDVWSRFCPVLRVCRQAKATDVVEALRQAVARCGGPRVIRVDQGCQFTSKELDLWAYAAGVALDFSRRGKPTDNAHAEAFNARLRAECLSQHWFLDLDDARAKVEAWRVDYNEVRPHGAIGGRPPVALISAPEQPPRGNQRPESLT
jgi:putative transposase